MDLARTTGSNGEKTAKRVRRAALELFSSEGYAATSMRRIAEEAGLQAGGIYNHFPTKQAILVDLLETHMHDLLAAWERESVRYQTPVAALDGFVRFHIRYHVDKQDAVFISYMELRNLEPENFRRIERLRRYYEGFVRKIISIGNESNEFDVPDVPIAAMAILSMLTGVNTWFRAGGRLSVDEIEQVYVSMALGSLNCNLANYTEQLRRSA